MLVEPFFQGPEGLRTTGEEDGAEPIEIDAKVTKSGRGIVGESWVLSLCRYPIERPDTPNEVFVGKGLFPEVVPDEAQRTTNVELETPVAASKLAARGRATAVVVVVRGDEREAGRTKDLCQLRCASVEHLPRIRRHRHSMARRPRPRRERPPRRPVLRPEQLTNRVDQGRLAGPVTSRPQAARA